MSNPQLATERLVLRRMRLDDTPAMHAILSDPEVMRYWSTLPHRDLAVTEAWVDRTIANVEAGDGDDFAILLNDTVIGKAGLWKGNEVGIILARHTWGRGLAAEALHAVIDRAFGRGIDHIVADIDPRNAASRRLFEKLRFRFTHSEQATLFLGEEWADSVFFALTREEWAAKRQPSGPAPRAADNDPSVG